MCDKNPICSLSMSVTAQRHVRKMRGGAQSHLLETNDGQFYVVKFQNNPQHRRILVNELLASVFLEYLHISTPDAALIHVSEAFVQNNPNVAIELGARKIPAATGWQFGSRYPGDPARVAVYDFVPDTLLHNVRNRSDFLGALAFDKWVSNADRRQAVFFRARDYKRVPEVTKTHAFGISLVAIMIDHGFAFNGPHWSFPNSPVQGLYARKRVYENVASLEEFEPWLERIRTFPEKVVDQAYKQVPPEWIPDEQDELEAMLERLMLRRKRVADLIGEVRRATLSPFPNWK